VSDSILGTKVILVTLTHLGRVLVSKKYLAVVMKSLPIMSQLLLKNKEVQISRPRTLSFGMENKTSLISSVMMHDSKREVMSKGNLLEYKREASFKVIIECVKSSI
jgi:hypothetical protein